MINPVESDLYRSVTHHRGGHGSDGLIKSFNDAVVMVLFNGHEIAVAVAREDLEWTHPDPAEAPVEAEL